MRKALRSPPAGAVLLLLGRPAFVAALIRDHIERHASPRLSYNFKQSNFAAPSCGEIRHGVPLNRQLFPILF
jgi:hypothetical protein